MVKIIKQKILKNIDSECADRCLRRRLNENTTTLYHCHSGNLAKNDFIWLSDEPDNTYGKATAEFAVPLGKLKLADEETTIGYIKKNDIRTFQEAADDEFAEMGLEWFDWDAYRNGKIGDTEAYENIPHASWAEVMEYPEYYTFAEKMKGQGYDGYYFTYSEGMDSTVYYLIFDANKILPYIKKSKQADKAPKTIIITESQYQEILVNEALLNKYDKACLAIAGMIAAGTLTFDKACTSINSNPTLSRGEKETIIRRVEQFTEEKENSNTADFKKEIQKNNTEKNNGWTLADDKTIVTVYNAVPEQCNADCGTTASGYKLNLDDVSKDRVVAMERTFMKKLGVKYGDWIKIEGTHQGRFDGVYQVQDTMNKRFAGQHKIDILVPNDIKYGGTNPGEYARIYVRK